MTLRRLLIWFLVLLVPGTILANVNLYDPLGYYWDIYSSPGNYGYILNGTSDAYDSWPYLCITSSGNTATCASGEVYVVPTETT